MMTGAAYYLHATLYRLRRNPVLTAMMVSSLVFGITVLIAGIAVWRVSSPCSIPQMSALPTVVQAVTEIASRSDLSIPHQALQAAQGMGIRQTPQGGSAFSVRPAGRTHWEVKVLYTADMGKC
jgi:hypothetical protein